MASVYEVPPVDSTRWSGLSSLRGADNSNTHKPSPTTWKIPPARQPACSALCRHTSEIFLNVYDVYKTRYSHLVLFREFSRRRGSQHSSATFTMATLRRKS